MDASRILRTPTEPDVSLVVLVQTSTKCWGGPQVCEQQLEFLLEPLDKIHKDVDQLEIPRVPAFEAVPSRV